MTHYRDEDETVTERVEPTVRQIKEGNGDWEANRKLIAYIMEQHSTDIDKLYDRQRSDSRNDAKEREKLKERLRNIEIRIATYVGIATAIIWFFEKGALS